MLWLWTQYEGEQVPKAWLKEQLSEDWRLGTVLTGFFGRSFSNGQVSYFISRKSVEASFTLDAKFEARLKIVERAKLSRWQSHAIGEALRIMEHMTKKISEIEFSG